jgi:serine/threonine-protein kinase
VVRRSSKALLALSLVASTLAVIVLFMAIRESQRASSVSASPTTPAPKTFVLSIESIPSNAEVLEGNEPRGHTPLILSISNDQVRTSERQLTLQLAGYEAYTILQGPSNEAIRLVIPLRRANETP